MFRYLPLILKNCWRNRRRTVLTIASIGISMCLLGVMVAMFHAFYLSDPTPEQALRLVARNRISYTVSMPLSYRAQIKQVPGVREVMVSQWFGGVYKDARDPKNQFPRYGIEPDKLFTIFSELHIPEDQRKAFVRDRTGCVIGRDLANTLGFKVGDRLNMTGDIFPGTYEFTIRGIFDSPRSSDEMYFDNEYLEQTMAERRRGNVIMYDILIDNPVNSARIAAAIDNQFHNSTAQTKTESEQAFVVGFLALLGNVKMFLLAISGAVLFTILLVSANTMAMSVRERAREVGILKTLGFTPASILMMILGEACAISMAGGILGYLISTLLMQGVAKSPFGGFLPAIRIFEPPVALVCVLAAGIIGVMSSLVPALSASRTTIVEALRSTD
ncbi:MAG: FtsX-like permease family protein [Bryobacteraceae bacterium]|jgi:putative ABC transport system permease protein